tara:strand:- start:2019 stop:3701 length:1683 start_codon:yes stop_codon:yes gene_type:complete
MRNRANRTQGTDLVLSAYKTYNKNYDAVMEGINDKSLAGEKMLFLKAQAESMFDFGKTGLYINPLNSEINVAKKQLVDGAYVMSDNPNEFLNASELMQAASAMYNGFDANTAAASLAESVGQRLIRDGFGNTIESAYMAVTGADNDTKSKIKQARLDQVRGILNNEDAGAYLTDTLNEGFSFTKDADEAATKNKVMSKMILLNQDGSTTLSKEQMDYAVDKFDTLLEVYLPKEKKAPLAPKPSAYQQKSEEQTVIDKQGVEAWAGMYYGTPEEQKGFADRILGSPDSRRQGLVEIDTVTKPGTFILKYKDKTKNREIEVVDGEGNALPYADYIALGNEIHGVDDYGKALELSGRKDAEYTTERGGRSRRKGSRKAYTAVDNKVNYRGTNINADNIIEKYITEDVADEGAVKVIRDVFEVQDLPNPIIEIEEAKEMTPARNITTGRGTSYVPSIKTEPSLKISVPGVIDSPIYIPEGDGMKEVLDKAIALIDQAYDDNNLLTPEDFKAIFPTENIFLEYNAKQPDAEESTTSETSTKRNVNQIMKDDGVSRVEAIKIFKEQ